MDGILGFIRPNASSFKDTREMGMIMVQEMAKAGKIPTSMFALYLATDPVSSSIELGGYDSSNMKNPAQLTWIPLTPDAFWKV